MGINWKMCENEPQWHQGQHPPLFPICMQQFLIFFFDSFTILSLHLLHVYCVVYIVFSNRQEFFFFLKNLTLCVCTIQQLVCLSPLKITWIDHVMSRTSQNQSINYIIKHGLVDDIHVS